MNGIVFSFDDASIWNVKMESGSADHKAVIVPLGLGPHRVCIRPSVTAELHGSFH